jgi:hypothetical protein
VLIYILKLTILKNKIKMKIKRFDEQVSLIDDQKQEILEIFLDMLDDEEIMEDSDNDQFIHFSIYVDEPTTMHDISDVDETINIYNNFQNKLENLKMQLNRLSDLNYLWEIEIEGTQINLIVWYNDLEPTIKNAFGTKDRLFINTPIIKKVLKDDYNLTYLGYEHAKGTDGRYGSNPHFDIYVQENISDDVISKIEKEIKSIEKQTGPNYIEKPFIKVSKMKYNSYDKKYDKYIIKVEYRW